MKTIKCEGCAYYRRTPIAVNDRGGGAYETACDLGKEDEFFTEEGCEEYSMALGLEERRDNIRNEITSAFDKLREKKVSEPLALFLGYDLFCSLKDDHPDTWKMLIDILRYKNAGLVLVYKGVPVCTYDIWKKEEE